VCLRRHRPPTVQHMGNMKSNSLASFASYTANVVMPSRLRVASLDVLPIDECIFSAEDGERTGLG
jgi:hypothetical protein